MAVDREHLRLLARYLESEADVCKTTAALWETDPQSYGTDIEGIAEERGREQGYRTASKQIDMLLIESVD